MKHREKVQCSVPWAPPLPPPACHTPEICRLRRPGLGEAGVGRGLAAPGRGQALTSCGANARANLAAPATFQPFAPPGPWLTRQRRPVPAAESGGSPVSTGMIDQPPVVHTRGEQKSALERKAVLTPATAGADPEDVTPSESARHERAVTVSLHAREPPRSRQIRRETGR